jgi:ABC-type metal ion transport system substrate-binding protein
VCSEKEKKNNNNNMNFSIITTTSIEKIAHGKLDLKYFQKKCYMNTVMKKKRKNILKNYY